MGSLGPMACVNHRVVTCDSVTDRRGSHFDEKNKPVSVDRCHSTCQAILPSWRSSLAAASNSASLCSCSKVHNELELLLHTHKLYWFLLQQDLKLRYAYTTLVLPALFHQLSIPLTNCSAPTPPWSCSHGWSIWAVLVSADYLVHCWFPQIVCQCMVWPDTPFGVSHCPLRWKASIEGWAGEIHLN